MEHGNGAGPQPGSRRRPEELSGDYSGPFRADFRYEDLSREALVRLVREYAQAVHILDRSMCAAIGMSHGMEEMERLAIEEWRGASPVYGQRLRRIMGVEGDDVEAIFKVLQLDPGFPHHYLDVRYEVVDEKHGYFELAYCGALMDAEPWGDKMVTGMCHHIEDGTFDVTAQAINPKAHIRHVHRPPRVPSDRVAALPLGAGHRRRQRDAARGGHHRRHQDDHRGHLRVPADARRDAPRSRGRPTDAEPWRTHRCRGRGDRRPASPTSAHAPRGHPAAADPAPGRGGHAAGAGHRREVEEVGYAGLTVRSVARRAGVAPATAYNYFSSKDHLLAEVLWRRMQALPPVEPGGRTRPMHERLAEAVRAMVLFTTESPALVDACTVALLSPNPDVKHLRDRIGAQIHRRLAAALGPEVDPLVVRVLETSFSGALLAAGMGHMASATSPASWPRRPTDGRSGAAGAGPDADGRPPDDRRTGHLQPVRLRDPRGPLPGLRPAAGRGAGLPQRRVRLLGPVPPRGRARRLPQRRRLLQLLRRLPRPERLRPRRPQGDVVPRPRPAAPHPDALAGGQGLHPVQGGRRWRSGSGPSPSSTSSPPSSGARSTSSPTSPASSRWT